MLFRTINALQEAWPLQVGKAAWEGRAQRVALAAEVSNRAKPVPKHDSWSLFARQMWAAVPTSWGRLKKLGPVLIDPQMYRGIEVISLNFTRIQILEVSIRDEPACAYTGKQGEG